jgi:hypothetical protein
VLLKLEQFFILFEIKPFIFQMHKKTYNNDYEGLVLKRNMKIIDVLIWFGLIHFEHSFDLEKYII